MDTEGAREIKRHVQERYAELARQHASSCCSAPSEATSSCCRQQEGDASRAQRLYSREELELISANISSLGCGNPIACSELVAGETLLDLGSGGGLDCFLAAQRVGPGGRVIGLDMTPDMVRLARDNARLLSLDNVEFRLGEMEHMPVDSGSVDVVISNCVVNLSPDKDAVFAEIYRVLKAGGRLSISDMVTHGELPPEVRRDMVQWAGCVAGALDERDYLGKIEAAGFVEVEVVEERQDDFRGAASCRCGDAPSYQVVSATVTARKPR
ncbi:MAG: arsenite methyltransferase [Chloroflexota bacterium]|nr:arsenite methyltransferase [Chloroflexota bacterium]